MSDYLIPAGTLLSGLVGGWFACRWWRLRRRRRGIVIPHKALAPLLEDKTYAPLLQARIAAAIAKWCKNNGATF